MAAIFLMGVRGEGQEVAGDLPQLKTMRMGAPDISMVAEWANTPRVQLPRLKGKVVLVHFWSVNSVLSESNISQLDTWQNAFQKQGFRIVAIHTTAARRQILEPEEVKQEMKKAKRVIDTGIDDSKNSVAKAWKVFNTPTLFLIDRKGIVRYRWDGVLDWRSLRGEAVVREKVKELLKEEP